MIFVVNYFSDRGFGPAYQSTTIFSFQKQVKLDLITKGTSAALGAGFLQDAVQIRRPNGADIDHKAWNLGLATSFTYRFPTPKHWHLLLHWDSYLFPAGFSGGLFLVTGRVSVIAASFGVDL